MELVTSLDLSSFLLAFTRFTNVGGSVDTFYSNNASTVCAAFKKNCLNSLLVLSIVMMAEAGNRW